MEDQIHVEVKRDPDLVYVAVFDGHGGPEAARFAKAHLLDNIMASKGFRSGDDAEVTKAIKEGFHITHHQMQQEVGECL